MNLQKLSVKVFVSEPDPVPLTAFVEIFHRWMQGTDGVYHDVADYSHIQSGPGIVLIAYHADLSIDECAGRRGLVFNQKSRLCGSPQERLRTVFQEALESCRKLEAEPVLRGRLCFATDEAVVSVNDRLYSANSQASFEAIRSEVEVFARWLFGRGAVVLDRDPDPRRRLSVRVKASVAPNLESLLNNLQHHREL